VERLRARLGRWLWPIVFVAGIIMATVASAPVYAQQARTSGSAAQFALLEPATAPGSALAPLPQATPTPAPASRPLRWVYMVGSSLPQGLIDHADQIDVLAPAWFHANANGLLYGSDAPAVTQFARAHGIKVIPIVANGEFQESVAHSLVSDGSRQTTFLDGLQWLVNNFGYDGVNIDFENLNAGDRALFSGMMTNVYARLHPLGKLVTIAMPSKTSERYAGFSGGFDYAGIAPNVDLALLMAYDQHYSGGPAGPIADVAWVNDVINYATTALPPQKILLGLPFYGYNWAIGQAGAHSMTYKDVVSTVLSTGAQIQMDQASQSPFFTYGGRIVWFENSNSLRAKLNLVTNHGLAGWGGWRLGQEDPNFWSLGLQR
jgi:spore germination protein YaaH